MPKGLTEQPPRSTVARLFNADVASRALQRSEPVMQHRAAPEPTPTNTRPVKREFALSPVADRVFRDLVTRFQDATGTSVTNSMVMRALLLALGPELSDLEAAVRQHGPWQLPGNGAAFTAEREEFEGRLVRVLGELSR